MSSVDLYDVLDLDHTCSKKDVIRAYRRLVKIYHPDKPTGDEDLFELIGHAYEVLIDPEKREKYDQIKDMSDKASIKHYARKEQFKSYKKLADESDVKKTQKEAELDFRSHQSLMDSKRGFNRAQYEEEKLQENKLTEDDLKEMEDDLEWTREQDEIEATPERIFKEGTKFDPNLFNLAWEKAFKKRTDIEVHGNPGANDDADGFGINNSYDDLFAGSEGGFASASFKSALDALTKEDIDSMNPKERSGYDAHTAGRSDEKYMKSLEDLIKRREEETKQLEDMTMKDFDTEDKEFRFLHEIGYDTAGELPFDDDEDMKHRYERLLEARKDLDHEIQPTEVHVQVDTLEDRMEKLIKKREADI